MTMKVKRRSSFFNLTKAPVTGWPDASLTTPWMAPRSCAAATDCAAISANPATIPSRMLPVLFTSVIAPSLVAWNANLTDFQHEGDGLIGEVSGARSDRPQWVRKQRTQV